MGNISLHASRLFTSSNSFESEHFLATSMLRQLRKTMTTAHDNAKETMDVLGGKKGRFKPETANRDEWGSIAVDVGQLTNAMAGLLSGRSSDCGFPTAY